MAEYSHQGPLLLVLLSTLSCATSLEIHGVEIASKLKNISENGLGRSRIEEIFHKMATFTAKAPTGDKGHDIVTKLAASVGIRFKKYSNAVKKLHLRLMEGMGNPTRDSGLEIAQCCKLNPQDNLDRWCYRHHSGSAEPVSYNQNILDVMKENKNAIPNIGWQYYGNEEGLFTFYPAIAENSCTEFDPRLRPWYVQASAPALKDIVIAVESTGQSEKTHIMRNALDILFDTTNPNDRLAVVKFGKDVISNVGDNDHSTCFSDDLALATPQNCRIFREFIDSKDSNTQGPVRLLPVITTAFGYFTRAAGKTKRRKLLVIFIASDPDETQNPSELIREIANNNAKLQRKVVIQTYAFGSNISNFTKEILQKIAENTTFETSSRRVQAGTFTHIQHRDQLRLQLRSYYSIFADSSIIKEPIGTVPYFDFAGLGLVMSLCLPLHLGGELQGVTCVDFEIEDIFFDVMYYHQGIDAYAFIIDSRGRTILHPLLPKPTERWEDPKFVHIMSLENGKGVQEIIESMISGGNGSHRFPDAVMKPSPEYIQDGQFLVSEYHWTKVPNTNYSLCMVFTQRDRELEMELLRADEWKDKKKNYTHPYMLNHGDKRLCHHDGQTATTDGSVVMFSGAAYKSLSADVNPYNSTQSQSYENFFQDSRNNQAPEFKKATWGWVALTGLVDTIWTEEASKEFNHHIMWRHLVTTSGVIRIYPGTNYTQYDPSSFLWYKQAILRGKWLQVSPVLKQGSFNVMLSQAILHSSPAPVPIGVVGGEIRPAILYNILQDVYPACRTARCFIVDGSGYILTHKRYSNEEVRPSHIVTMEPVIAHHLMDNGHMVVAKCLDFLSQYRTLFNWKIALRDWYVSSTSPQFELHSVPGTDVYVGITWDNNAMQCNCENITKCMDNQQDVCRCPCFRSLKFNLCNNTLPEEAKNGPSACSILRNDFDVMLQFPVKNVSVQLEPCFKSNCRDIKTESFCSMKNGCQWCMSDGEKHLGCHNRSFCGPGMSPTRERSVVIVAVPVILILLVTIIIIAVCFIFRHSLCVHAKLCVKESLCGDPIYEQAGDAVGSTSKIKTKPEHDDSGMASDDVNDEANIFVISVQDRESSKRNLNAIPPLPNRNPHKAFLPLPDNDEENPMSKKSQANTSHISVFPESQTEKDTVAKVPGTPDFNQLLEDSAENTYVNESADITFDPHEFDSLSLQLSLFRENGQSMSDGKSQQQGSVSDNQEHSVPHSGSVEDNSAGVSSRDSGVLSAVSRQGSSQTYPKTP